MSRRKPLAASAAVAAALALAVPAASATASPRTPTVRHAFGAGGLTPGSLPCQFLIGEVRFATAAGYTPWANIVSNAFVYSGCGGAAI